MNGTDGSTTFTDSSSASHTPSSTGGSTISNDQSKFGGGSGYFNNNRLRYAGSVGNLDGTSNSWTIEMWVYPTTEDSNNRYLLNKDGQHNVIVNAYGLYYSNSGIAFNYRNSAGNYKDVNSGGTPFNYNEWNHLAIVRDGSTSITIFLNGVKVGQKTTDLTMGYDSNRYLDIGTGNFNTVDHFVGYLEELRITKGVARYTSNFTPQAREFYPGDSVSDLTSNDIYSVLNGDVTLNQSTPKYYEWPNNGRGSDYIRSVSNLNTLPTLNDDFTIIAWVEFDDSAFSNGKHQNIFRLGDDTYNSNEPSNIIFLSKRQSDDSNSDRRNRLQLRLINSDTDYDVYGSKLTTSTGWFQVAATVSSSTMKLYLNTNLEGSVTIPSNRNSSTPSFFLGFSKSDNSNNADMYGKISINKVYDSALSQADITSEFNYHKSTFGL